MSFIEDTQKKLQWRRTKNIESAQKYPPQKTHAKILFIEYTPTQNILHGRDTENAYHRKTHTQKYFIEDTLKMFFIEDTLTCNAILHRRYTHISFIEDTERNILHRRHTQKCLS